MRDISLPPIPAPAGPRRLGIFAATLLCCLLCACSSKNVAHLNTLMIQRPAFVDASLKAQGQLQAQTFQLWIGLMQQYNGQVSTYEQQLLSDRRALAAAKTDAGYQAALQALQQHTDAIQLPALKNEADYQEQQLTQEATAWENAHTYHDSYNGTTYHMGYEYGSDGVAGWVQDELTSAKTVADYQQAVEDANNFLSNFRAYQINARDTTPWSSSHQTDLQLMNQYHTLDQKVVVVSLNEETMRVYNQGKLVKAFHVTTGRPEKPSLPGFWVIENKQSPTVFKSDEPKGSAYWYPDTPISYAMLYHSGGYFLHDSWWRADYGPNTQFPHYDSSGDSFSFDGSHGCVNIATDNAAWLYNYVDLNTHVIIY
jgi:lipoprotein-anchoring transpeptidase ErfK/SrfK